MDNCHCIDIYPEKVGDSYICLVCHLFYDEAIWKRDPRVIALKKKAAAKNIVRRPVRPKPDVYRPCACGSGKKIRFCCGWDAQHSLALAALANMKDSTSLTEPETPQPTSTSSLMADHPASTPQASHNS